MSSSRDFNEGYSLASTLVENMPPRMQAEQWRDAIAQLKEFCTSQTSDDLIWRWFKTYRPEGLKPVATDTAGKSNFAAGVRNAYLDNELDL